MKAPVNNQAEFSPEQLQRWTAALDEVMAVDAMRVVFQPIVGLTDGYIEGYEVLARYAHADIPSLKEFFVAAIESNRVGELGRRLREKAIQLCPDKVLFFNLVPNEFDEPYLVQPDDPIFRHRRPIYLEITETVPISHFEQCHSVLKELRTKGLRLAIDDLGAGYSNLKYISDLAPNIVKLDRELIAGVHLGSRGSKLVAAIVFLCQQMGTRVVAEGVETVEEFHMVQAAAADLCQGYFLARPAAEPLGLVPRPEAGLPAWLRIRAAV